MLSIKKQIAGFVSRVKRYRVGNLQNRFILRVLTPPFVALLLASLVGFWQYGKLVQRQAIGDLSRSATTTAAKLEREFAIRETVLKRTGEELFSVKSAYLTNRAKLDQAYQNCRTFVQQKGTFAGAPDTICEPFTTGYTGGRVLPSAVDAQYARGGETLIANQNQQINERLTAFKQFFPETLALMVVDNKQAIVSSAVSPAFHSTIESFQPYAVAALKEPLLGKRTEDQEFRLATFAYPIEGGSVLAVYDLDNSNFLRSTWESAPIDKQKAFAVVLDPEGKAAYPILSDKLVFQENITKLRKQDYAEFKINNTKHIAVAAEAGSSKWLVSIASPTAAVLAPVHEVQYAAATTIGLLLVGFLWVGNFFIQRMVRNIIRLVSGAIVFASGKLGYNIQLSHADKEFEQLADTMNIMAQRIADAELAIDEKNKEFISVATHELRAPMTAIIGHLSLMKELYGSTLDPKCLDLVDQAYYGTARLRDLVNDMLNVARLESGRSELSFVPVKIKTVVGEVVDTMGIVAQIAKVKLKYHTAHAREVVADEATLRIIINNFVSNAIKYNRPSGSVTVAHYTKGKFLVTSIADTGLGIPEDQKAHMFEKFFRVQHEDRKSVAGTGLGLYITKQYVEKMHGELWFESEHGKGTTFFFSLPQAVKVTPKKPRRVRKHVAHLSLSRPREQR